MQLSAQIDYPASPDAVYAMLTDRVFLEQVCAATGALSSTVEVVEAGGGATVTTRRELPTDEVPDFVKRFVGATLSVLRVDRWDAAAPDGARTGTITVEIAGAPVRLTGTLSMRGSAGRTTQDVVADLKASVPLVGGKIEKAAEPAIRSGLSVEERLGKEWLARAAS